MKAIHKIKNWHHAIPSLGIVAITGFIRQGKTALAWWLAEKQHDTGRLVVAYRLPHKARKELPSWVKHADTVKGLSGLQNAVVVIDEAALNANARRTQSSENVDWSKLAAIIGQKEILGIWIAQHGRQLDPALVAGAQVFIHKKPSLLYMRFARPELLPEMQKAFEYFQHLKGDPRRWAMAVDYLNGAEGFLKCHLPSFWSDNLSRAFATVDLEGVEHGNGKRPRVLRIQGPSTPPHRQEVARAMKIPLRTG